MNFNPNIFLSFTAGLLAFFSPCVFPIIPSYLGFIGGVSLAELREGRYKRISVFFRTLAFVSGFLLVFSIVGLLIFGTFYSLGNLWGWLDILAGLIVIILGLNFIFNFIKILNMEKRFRLKNKVTGLIGAFIVGMAFGAGWTPCIGPLLQSIFLLTAATETSFYGLINLFFFSLGLGLPFLLLSLFFPLAMERLDKLKKYMPIVRIASGIFLVGIGILILSGRVQAITFWFMVIADNLLGWSKALPLAFTLAGAFLFLGLAIIILIPFIRRSLNGQGGRLPVGLPTICFAVFFIILAFLELTGLFRPLLFLADWFKSA